MIRAAHLSEDRAHRFTLMRCWDDSESICNFIGLNPSTADESHDDPTIRRCINFATAWGDSRLYMTNLFSFRATMPHVMLSEDEPTKPTNDAALLAVAKRSRIVIAAWGVHGSHRGRDKEVARMLESSGVRLHYLDLTKAGHPRHPLYIPKIAQPKPFPPNYWQAA